MSLSALEIVQLKSGEIVVRRAGQDEEPLLKLDFSEESQNYLQGATMDVARAMIKAGIEAVFELGLVDSQLDLEGSGLAEVLEEGDFEADAFEPESLEESESAESEETVARARTIH